jgi:hypothetical protein
LIARLQSGLTPLIPGRAALPTESFCEIGEISVNRRQVFFPVPVQGWPLDRDDCDSSRFALGMTNA